MKIKNHLHSSHVDGYGIVLVFMMVLLVLELLILQATSIRLFDSASANRLLMICTIALLCGVILWGVRVSNTKDSQLILAQEQIKFQAQLLDSVMDAVIATNLAYEIVYWNPAAVQLYGWQPDEVLGREASALLKTTFQQTTAEESRKQLTTEGNWRGEVIQYDSRQKPILLLCTVSLIRDHTGMPVGIVAVNRDISWRKKLEADLLETEKQRLALAAEHEVMNVKQDFVTTVSHDFRTPLTIIQLNTEKLERYSHVLSPEQRDQAITQIKGQIAYMTRLLDEISLARRIWVGQIQFMPQTMNLFEVLGGVLTEIKAIHRDKHHLIWQLGADMNQAFTFDPMLLRRILDNLISNAVKYSPEGGEVRVTAGLMAQDDKPGVEIVITDNGIGIPVEDQAHLFDSFYRAKNVEGIPGSGLGLAIVHSCVQLHQGEISFKSAENKGTTFTVWLPLSSDAFKVETVANARV